MLDSSDSEVSVRPVPVTNKFKQPTNRSNTWLLATVSVLLGLRDLEFLDLVI